jgi:hypothetical protein
MIFKNKRIYKLETTVFNIEGDVASLKLENKKTVQQYELERDYHFLKGVVIALLEHLNVEVTKEFVADSRCLPVVQVYRIKSKKYK